MVACNAFDGAGGFVCRHGGHTADRTEYTDIWPSRLIGLLISYISFYLSFLQIFLTILFLFLVFFGISNGGEYNIVL